MIQIFKVRLIALKMCYLTPLDSRLFLSLVGLFSDFTDLWHLKIERGVKVKMQLKRINLDLKGNVVALCVALKSEAP